jgi:DNA polymerase III gamma/tau subunit
VNLADKYRPRDWPEVIGQPKAVAMLQRFEERGSLGGRAYFISGKSGTGKTTLARIIASKIADSWNVEEMDAADLNADTIRRIQAESALLGMGVKTGRAYIVNEAHGLNANQVRKLLTLLEPGEIPGHVVWIFTTTIQGQAKLFEGIDDSGPLLSRCTVIELAQRDLAARFAERAREIAQAEGMDGQPIERYARLVKDCNCNFRAVLQAIDAGEMIQ